MESKILSTLGIDPGIRVGEAGELGLLRESVLERVIESFYENNSDFTNFSDAFSSDKNDEVIGFINFDIIYESEKHETGDNVIGEDGNDAIYIIVRKR